MGTNTVEYMRMVSCMEVVATTFPQVRRCPQRRCQRVEHSVIKQACFVPLVQTRRYTRWTFPTAILPARALWRRLLFLFVFGSNSGCHLNMCVCMSVFERKKKEREKAELWRWSVTHTLSLPFSLFLSHTHTHNPTHNNTRNLNKWAWKHRARGVVEASLKWSSVSIRLWDVLSDSGCFKIVVRCSVRSFRGPWRTGGSGHIFVSHIKLEMPTCYEIDR